MTYMYQVYGQDIMPIVFCLDLIYEVFLSYYRL